MMWLSHHDANPVHDRGRSVGMPLCAPIDKKKDSQENKTSRTTQASSLCHAVALAAPSSDGSPPPPASFLFPSRPLVPAIPPYLLQSTSAERARHGAGCEPVVPRMLLWTAARAEWSPLTERRSRQTPPPLVLYEEMRYGQLAGGRWQPRCLTASLVDTSLRRSPNVSCLAHSRPVVLRGPNKNTCGTPCPTMKSKIHSVFGHSSRVPHKKVCSLTQVSSRETSAAAGTHLDSLRRCIEPCCSPAVPWPLWQPEIRHRSQCTGGTAAASTAAASTTGIGGCSRGCHRTGDGGVDARDGDGGDRDDGGTDSGIGSGCSSRCGYHLGPPGAPQAGARPRWTLRRPPRPGQRKCPLPATAAHFFVHRPVRFMLVGTCRRISASAPVAPGASTVRRVTREGGRRRTGERGGRISEERCAYAATPVGEGGKAGVPVPRRSLAPSSPRRL